MELGNNGIGDAMEPGFYDPGYRDTGQDEPWAQDTVYDPKKCGPIRLDPQQQSYLDAMICAFEDRIIKRSVFFVKRPAFLEPPFFSKPLLKVAEKEVANNTTVNLLERQVEDRQRAVVTSIGIGVDDTQALANRELAFWFEVNGVVVPLFDDQSTTIAAALLPLEFGKTTIFPGSIEAPFNIREAGLTVLIRGPSSLNFRTENRSGATVKITAIMTYYQYWLPNAGEFEQADNQI